MIGIAVQRGSHFGQAGDLYDRTVRLLLVAFLPFLVASSIADGAREDKVSVGLSAASRQVDLGDHPAWVGEKATFTLRNASDRSVSVVKVRTSCGCAKAVMPDGDIAPGKGAELVVEIKPNTLRGPYTKHVFVHWRQEAESAGDGEAKPRTGLLRLTIRGNAKPLLTVRPGTVVALGKVPIGEQVKRELLLEAGPSRIVLGEPALPPEISLEMVGRELKPGGKLPFSLVFRSGKAGRFRCVLSIPVVSPKGHPPVGVVVHGVCQAGRPAGPR
jgi:hypothetical protein